MKNLNKVRFYFGHSFIFDDEIMADHFVELYRDLFYKIKISTIDEKILVHVLVKKGVVEEIRKSLQGFITKYPKRTCWDYVRAI